MRKITFLALLAALVLAPFASADAATGSLPRYSSITDASATSFTVSFRNLERTEYVTCELPAPVACLDPEDEAGDNGDGIGGIRNEAGTLQVTYEENGEGGVEITAHQVRRRDWDEVASWTLVGGVNRVLVANDGEHFVVFAADGTVKRYDVDEEEPVSSATIGATGSALTLSSTGKFLAWYRPATLGGDGQRCYFLAETGTGKVVQGCDAVSYWDLVSEDNRVFAFSPNDRTMIFRSDRDGYQAPYKVDLALGLPATLGGERIVFKPYQVADLAFIDNSRLAIVANRSGATSWGLWALNVHDSTITEIAGAASYGVPLRRFGDYVSFARTNQGGVSATLYNVNTGTVTSVDGLAASTIPAGNPIPAPSVMAATPDGGSYALWEPSRLQRGTTPVVIWLHGGPYRQIGTSGYHPFASYGSFDWMLEELRLSGAAVAKLDYPGSYGYGRSYAESLTGQVGVKDVAAVRSLIGTLRARYGMSTPIYLVGNSYGGYLADKALVEMSGQVAGIYSISGVSGWEELIAGYPQTIFAAQFRNAPFGQQDPLFANAEVLLKAGNIGRQKVLLAHGDSDTSVGVSQTRTWEEVLKIAGKDVQATYYQGEDHVFARKENIADLCRKAISLVGGSASGRCEL